MKSFSAGERGLLGFICSLADRIRHFINRIEAVPGKHPERIALLIYAVAHLVMAIFHEPWYDEAVAWQIARCASIRDILFEIPHYEGHPPLWHLILLPFAKLGAPYELSLSIVSLIFAGAAVGLIIWKSPFPRIVRLLLPFTYFFFYQYGVISRPYCVMMLAFVLLAMAHRGRNEKPGRYVLSLMLLCLTSAYGIVIAGGLAMVWVWEIWNRRKIGAFLKSFLSDRRIWWLAGLLALALLLIVGIMPREDTYATMSSTYDTTVNSVFLRAFYMLLILPADVTITSVYSYHTLLKYVQLDPISMGCVAVLGVIFWLSVMLWGKRKKSIGILLVPYLMYALFSAIVYAYAHHIGIGLLLIIFWLWVTYRESATERKERRPITESGVKVAKNVLLITCSAAVCISLFWNGISCVKDVFTDYAAGRNEAKFIRENNLDQYRIMVGWNVYYDDDENIVGMDINHCHNADNVAPYFTHNLFFNFNDGRNDLNYSTHRCSKEEETAARLEQWLQNPPDVLYMPTDLDVVYDTDVLSMDDYTLVYSEITGLIWKGTSNNSRSDIYVRNELAAELGLEEVEEAYPLLVELIGKLMR